MSAVIWQISSDWEAPPAMQMRSARSRPARSIRSSPSRRANPSPSMSER